MDGRLSAGEIDQLILSPSVNGLEAAAVAAIHQYLRGKGAPTGLTQADLLAQAQQQAVVPEAKNSQEPLRTDLNDGKPRFVTYYAFFAAHLKKAPRDLYDKGIGIRRTSKRRGTGFQRFVVEPIAMPRSVDRPDSAPCQDGTDRNHSQVMFPALKPVRVPRRPTARSPHIVGSRPGTLINVLEKAFGR